MTVAIPPAAVLRQALRASLALVLVAMLSGLVSGPAVHAQAETAESLTAACDDDRDADACMAMAIKSYEGREVALDHALSRRFSAKACAEGAMMGCNLLGALLQDGAGGPQDLAGAARNFRYACEGGYDGACFNLGQLLYNNYSGDPADLVEARAAYAKACEAGMVDSCNNRAVMLKYGEGGDADLPAARALFVQSCEAGSVNACASAGYMLMVGEGGPADTARAAEWLRSSCESGSAFGCDNYTWRRLAMSGELTGTKRAALPAFAEVEVSEPPLLVVPPSAQAPGRIGIELPSGVKLTVDAGVDADALARVIGVLSR